VLGVEYGPLFPLQDCKGRGRLALMSQREFTGASSSSKTAAGRTSKPAGRFVRREAFLKILEIVTRLVVESETNPIELNARLEELRVLESEYDG